ncbi:hypothetical protein K1Y80_30875 [Streptomyces sp. MAG02]|nr:hypothetical protein [Streptomyces sp. MAG02]
MATLLGPVSAQAMDTTKPVDPHKKWAPPHTALPRTPSVHGTKTPTPSTWKPHYPVPGDWAGPPASEPAATGTAILSLTGSSGVLAPQAPRAGKLPIWVTPADGKAKAPEGRSTESVLPAAAGTALRVGVVDSKKARATGAQGPVVTVERTAAGPAGRIEIGVDVRELDAAYGADAASRSRLVELPACALSTPDAAPCRRQTPISSHFDPTTHRVVTDLTLPATAPADKSGAVTAPSLVLATDTTSGGGGGTYAASSLSPSAGWSAGSSSGGFTYSYPIQAPPSPGGDAPSIALSYDSSSVDGKTSSTNSQASWIGDGWDYSPGFVERSYKSCDQDGIQYSGDLCWGGYNAMLSLGGQSSLLVRDDTTGVWRLKDDSGSKVEFLTGAGNGTPTGEYVKVSTTSGTVYYFGLNHLPGGDKTDPASNSAWIEPVYSPKSGDPCYDSAKGADSWCQMAWRWNLDYSVDAHGNLTTYTYTAESNYYARGGGQHQNVGTQTAYTRGGALATIAYGQRLADQVTAKGALRAAAKVAFTPTPGGRCSTDGGFVCTGAVLSSSNAAHWPDVPYDQNCTATGTCTHVGPTFWSNVGLDSITTQVLSNGAYKNVDAYKLTHSYPDPADSDKPTLWLAGVQRTGKSFGTDTPLPSVAFTPTERPNRVDGTNLVPAPTAFNRPRIQAITTETGEQMAVDYNSAPCSRVDKVMPSSADTDKMACYNVKWYPPGTVYGADPASDWFNRYTVASVSENDPVTHAASQVTKYTYGPAAWHYDTDELIDPKTRTWDQFRGFATVTTTTGNGQDGPVTRSVTTYLQGMDGDTLPGGATRSVKVPDTLDGTRQVTDSDWLAGQVLERDTYDKAGGTVTAHSFTAATGPHTTATHIRGSGLPDLVARYGATTTVATTKGLKADGTWRTATTTTRADPDYGNRTVSVDSTADDQPEQCTVTSYATGSNALMTGIVDESRTLSGSNACTATPTAPITVSDTRSLYDGLGFGKAGAKADLTSAQALDHYDSADAPVYVTTALSGYDAYGRVTSVTDPNTTDSAHPTGATTTTAYTPAASGELPATISITSPAPGSATGWTASTTLDVGRGIPLTSTDLNNETTTKAYDGLGRLTAVWVPGRSTSQKANVTYAYTVKGSAGPSTVTTSTLENDGAHYKQAVALYDGLGRPRQTQTTPGSSAYAGRIVADTFYDSHGWAVETRSPYYDDSAAPGATLFTTTDNQVPGQTITTYNGQGQVTATVFSSFATEQWRTTTSHPGIDETDVTPPSGATPTTTVNDAGGHTRQLWQYKTPTATGKAADADVTTYTYTPSGSPATRTDATGKNTWTYAYDLRGRQISATDPDTGTTVRTYDGDGRLSTVTDARHQTLSYDYDLIGRKAAEYSATPSAPSRLPLAAWTYDTATFDATSPDSGHPVKGQPAKSTRYVDGRTDAGYSSEVTKYDIGLRATATATTIPVGEGKLAGQYTSTATYDPITGALSQMGTGARGDIAAETLDYTYDINGPLDTFGSNATTYDLSTDYDAFGRAIRTTVNPWGTQIVATDNYDDATGNLLSSWVDKQTAANGGVQQTSYSRNPAGQITAIRNIPDDTPTQSDVQCFSYDHLNRLTTSWTDNGGTTAKAQPSVANIGGCKNTSPTSGAIGGKTTVGGPAPYWTSYTYDTTGNRTTLTQHDAAGDTTKDVTTTQTFAPVGQANQPTTATDTGGGTGGAHALLSSTISGPGSPGATSYQYDAIGDSTAITTTAGTTSLTWDPEGRLASTSSTGGSGATSYVYDTSGNQLVRRGPGKTTLTLGADELNLDAATNAVHATRTYALPNGLTAVRTAGGIAWQAGDNHGTATLALDYKTLAETRRPTDPFGNPRGTQPAVWAGDHGFVGGTQDPATGLTNLGAREYQPATGRFINPDPLLDTAQPQQWNGYAYSNNNPVNQSDPTGLRSECGQNGDSACSSDAGSAGGGSAVNDHCGDTNTCGSDVKCTRSCKDIAQPDPTTKTGYTEIYPNVIIRNDTPRFSEFRRAFYREVLKSCRDGGYDCFDPTAYNYEVGTEAVVNWITNLQLIEGYAAMDVGTYGMKRAFQSALAAATVYKLMGGSLRGGGRGLGRSFSNEELADVEELGRSCKFNSFAPETEVRLADGSSQRIDHIQVGDHVLATDPLTGKTESEAVTKIILTKTDKDFTDLTVSTPSGAHSITSTQHHPYWSSTRQRWVDAAELRAGEALRDSTGHVQHVIGVHNYVGHVITYNLTVAQLHTYYVLAGTTPVLVHNSDCGPVANKKPSDLALEMMEADFAGVAPMTAGTPEFAQATSDGGRFLWAVGENGTLHIMPDAPGLHHTVMTGGNSVIGAGQVTITSRGVVSYIDNRTGHYTPCPACAAQFLQQGVSAFEQAGVRVPLSAIRDYGGSAP